MADAASVLIAGCGDVGMRAAALLRARGEAVLCLRRNTAALPPGQLVLAADLTDAASLRALPRGIRRLLFVAAPDARDAVAYRRIYVHGLAHLLDALDPDRLQRAVLVSSSAVYGGHGGGRVDEDTPPAPLAFNGRVLLEAERLLRARVSDRGVVLRLAGLYGPGRTQLLSGRGRHAAAAARAVRVSGGADRRTAGGCGATAAGDRQQAPQQCAVARQRLGAALAGNLRRLRSADRCRAVTVCYTGATDAVTAARERWRRGVA